MSRARHAGEILSFTTALAIAPFAAGCSLGQGTGDVQSDLLYAKECWCSTYNLQPDFFAAVPYRDTLQIRVQHGTDLQEVSDGLAVLVDDVKAIRPKDEDGDGLADDPNDTGLLNKKLKVALPTGVEPPGAGTLDGGVIDAGGPQKGDLTEGCGPVNNPLKGACALDSLYPRDENLVEGAPLVHMGLYLQQSCHNQNIVLYAVKGTIIFRALFSGDPNEERASDKLIEAIFDVDVGDLHEVPVGAPADAVPAEKLTNVKGCFRFYFERGQPGQPFP